MHEMSIAQSLLDVIREEMRKHNAKALKSVLVHIGKLSAIVPESLSFCFEVMTSGTEFEGATLNMKIIPLTGNCKKCGRTFEIKDYAFECPFCDGTDIETLTGQELSVVEMEVE